VVVFDRQPVLPVAVPQAELLRNGDAGPGSGRTWNATDALAVLESLKLGVVPDEALEDISVGVDGLLAEVVGDLERTSSASPGGALRLLMGGYGQGKSHLLSRIEKTALDRGFLVARATFGKREAAPDSPMEVYRSLVGALRYPRGLDVGLLRLLEEAARNKEVCRRWTGSGSLGEPWSAPAPDWHEWLSVAMLAGRDLTAADMPDALEHLSAWIGGQPQPPVALQTELREAERRLGFGRRMRRPGWMRPRGLPHWRALSHVATYLLGGIGRLARDVGYSGLVILLDEAEHFEWMAPRQVEHARQLASSLQILSLPERDASALTRGGRSFHQTIPHRFRSVQHVATFVALTPQSEAGPAFQALLDIPDVCRSTIRPLSAEDSTCLAGRVLALAASAGLDGQCLEAGRSALLTVIEEASHTGRPFSPRQVVKMAATLPDALRSHQDSTPPDLRQWIWSRRGPEGW
jgi:hypothetical protein